MAQFSTSLVTYWSHCGLDPYHEVLSLTKLAEEEMAQDISRYKKSISMSA